jgi:hypothetical protein
VCLQKIDPVLRVSTRPCSEMTNGLGLRAGVLRDVEQGLAVLGDGERVEAGVGRLLVALLRGQAVSRAIVVFGMGEPCAHPEEPMASRVPVKALRSMHYRVTTVSTSSDTTEKNFNGAFPNDVVMATSVASRPVAMRTRPIRR